MARDLGPLRRRPPARTILKFGRATAGRSAADHRGEAPAMTETAAPTNVTLELNPDEVQVVRTALQLLRSTLGRQEADELDEVRALLTRLEDLRAHVNP
jgi:hypothetical protein